MGQLNAGGTPVLPELEGAAIQASVISPAWGCTPPPSHPQTILQFLLRHSVNDRELTASKPVCPDSRQLFLLGSFSLCQVQVLLSCKHFLCFW